MSIRVTTRNLFDKDMQPYITNSYIQDNGYIYNAENLSIYKLFLSSGNYTLTTGGKSDYPAICAFDKNNNVIRSQRYFKQRILTFNVPTGTEYVLFSVGTNPNSNNYELDIFQLEEGTTATPYVHHLIEPTRIVQTTRNLFDNTLSKLTRGYYLDENGQERWGSSWNISGYIPINGSCTVSGAPSGWGASVCLYDEDKNFLTGEAYEARTTVTLSHPDAKYARFTMFDSELDTAQLELGTVATSYVPHLVKIDRIVRKTEGDLQEISSF